MKLTGAVLIYLRALEIGQHNFVRPAQETELGLLAEIQFVASAVDLRVDGGAAANHLRLGYSERRGHL